MKKATISLLFFLLLNVSYGHTAESARQFKGNGEVVTVDPVYSQITILHGAIKGFAQDSSTQFYVTDAAHLKNITKGDLVDFDLTDTKGDVKITKIMKTGVASPKENGIPIGQAVRETLQGTGQVLGAITSPLPPVSDAIHGAMNSTADVANPEITDGELKQKASF